jgi:hypothetical protein
MTVRLRPVATLAMAMLVAAPAAHAQVSRIAYLSLAGGPSPRSEAFRQGLRELGYVEGRTLQ